MAEHMRTELVIDALAMAVAARGGDHAVAGVINHADRGAQYTSNDYLDYCHARQLRPSVGRTGICWDNAVAESFWESLKRECIQTTIFATRAEARRAIFRWINWSTHRGSTAASTTPHHSSGNSNTVKRHNHPSVERGECQPPRIVVGRGAVVGGGARRRLQRRDRLQLNACAPDFRDFVGISLRRRIERLYD